MQPRQQLSRPVLLLTLLGVSITFYFMFTYTGPFQWLAELQLKWAGEYEEKLTFLFTALLVMAVLGLPLLLIKKLGIANPTTTDAAGNQKPSTISAWFSEFLVIGLVGLGFAIAGVRAYYIAGHAGPSTAIDVKDLETGQKPASLFVTVHGIAIPKASVEFGESTSRDQFIPVISGENDPEQTGAHLFLKMRSTESIPATGHDEADYPGFLTPADLPGPVRVIMEKQGVLKSADYYVLELNVTPEKKMADAKIMFYVGAGLVAVGVVFAIFRRLRKPRASQQVTPPAAPSQA